MYDDNNNPTNLIAQNMQNNYSRFESSVVCSNMANIMLF